MNLALIALLLFSSSVQAAAPCAGFAALDLKMGRCEDNAELGEAALACVREYRARVQKAQTEVLNNFQAELEKMKKEQSDSFDRTQSGYEKARKTLQSLIQQGRNAHLAVEDLYYNLYFPSDSDAPEITGKSPEEYLDSEECFATPRNVLRQSKRMIEKMTNDLVQLEQAALGKQNHSGLRSTHVQAIEPPRKTSGTYGKGSGKAPGRRAPSSTSDISGTKKAIEDARKGSGTAGQPPKN